MIFRGKSLKKDAKEPKNKDTLKDKKQSPVKNQTSKEAAEKIWTRQLLWAVW